jgi:hypothetical protein
VAVAAKTDRYGKSGHGGVAIIDKALRATLAIDEGKRTHDTGPVVDMVRFDCA